jgi:hypothetical protein
VLNNLLYRADSTDETASINKYYKKTRFTHRPTAERMKKYHAQYPERKKAWPENKHLKNTSSRRTAAKFFSIITTALALC